MTINKTYFGFYFYFYFSEKRGSFCWTNI